MLPLNYPYNPATQEPIVSSGHICTFESMEVRSVLLDEVMKDPENPTDDLVVNLDIKVSHYRVMWRG